MDKTSMMKSVAMHACMGSLLALCSMTVWAFVCLDSPQAIVTVTGIEFYVDDKHSVIDSRLEQQSVEQSKPLRDSLYELGQMADGTGRARDLLSAECALGWLRQWAHQGAFTKLGRGGTVLRAIAVASATNAYRVLLGRVDVLAEDRTLIGDWFAGVARSIIEQENLGRPGDLQNNVTSWSALAVYNVGVLQRDEHLKRWATEVYHRALGSLNANGFFANEIKRGRQALRYQWFALAPLVILYVVSDADDGLRSSDDTAQLGKALVAANAALTDVGPISKDARTEVDADGIRDYALTRAIARLSRCVATSSAAVNLGVPPDHELTRDWRLGSAFVNPTCGDVARSRAPDWNATRPMIP